MEVREWHHFGVKNVKTMYLLLAFFFGFVLDFEGFVAFRFVAALFGFFQIDEAIVPFGALDTLEAVALDLFEVFIPFKLVFLD